MKKAATGGGWAARLEFLVNVSLVLVGLTLVASLANRLFWQKPDEVAGQSFVVGVGSKLSWPDMNWAGNGRTVVLALSTTCHFCTESAPFLQRLTREVARHGGSRIVAVMPQQAEEGRKYLGNLGLVVNEVRQANMASIGLPATPTLAIVDRDGVVTGNWVGRLGVNQQYDVFRQLEIDAGNGLADADSGTTIIDADTLRRALERKDHLTLLNVDGRDLYKLAHIPDSVNIPADELETRSGDELPPDDTLIIYSRFDDDTVEGAAGILAVGGYKKVSILRGGYAVWKELAEGADVRPQPPGDSTTASSR